MFAEKLQDLTSPQAAYLVATVLQVTLTLLYTGRLRGEPLPELPAWLLQSTTELRACSVSSSSDVSNFVRVHALLKVAKRASCIATWVALSTVSQLGSLQKESRKP